MATVITAPQEFNDNTKLRKFFLAGTIDSGNSENWQKQVIDRLVDNEVIIFNPRREFWPDDSDTNEVQNQIKWEHEMLDKADIIIMNILPTSKSPISLMEIGLYAQSKKLIVFCNNNFYRYDNVFMVCQKYRIPLSQSNDIETIIMAIQALS